MIIFMEDGYQLIYLTLQQINHFKININLLKPSKE